MSKNTSPQSRSTSGPRSSARGRGRVKAASPSAARVAKTVGKETKARRATGPVTWRSRLRRMFFVVAVPNLVVFFSLAVIATATVLLTSSPSAWLPTAIAQSWMVTNLAPVVAADLTISALPILPALILGWMLAGNIHRAIKDKVSVNDLLALLGWVIAIPIVLIAIAWFMLWDASQVYDLSPPPLGNTIARALVLHLAALVIGMGPRLWRALAKRYKVPRAVVDGVVLAALSLLALLAIAAVVLLVALAVNWKNQALIADSFPHLAGLGLFAVIGLSVLYLPNALVAVAGILLGSEFHLGDASVSLFSVHLVPLPPLPLLGAVPGSASTWAIGLLVLTAVAIGYVAVKKRPSFYEAAASGVAAGIIVLVSGYLTAGELGLYESVGLMVFMAAGLAVVWIGGIGLAVAAGMAIKARRDEAAGVSVAAPAEATTEETESRESTEAAESSEILDTGEADEASDDGAVDYIDGEFEEDSAAADDDDDPQEEEVSVGAMSEDLIDNLEDGSFPDEVPGEDDIEDRLGTATHEPSDREDIDESGVEDVDIDNAEQTAEEVLPDSDQGAQEAAENDTEVSGVEHADDGHDGQQQSDEDDKTGKDTQ
ncbi:DUF6350 family protein [Corynebacterium sp. J010B-136]|uniref:cell division protein PerM n=1 Tax=Corynebacterium sp. J010B-136 TaxID=2099401 RepID=UPI0018EBF5A9|nr:DUF6350 family protein [Corynebacterium sp. J010B-136]